jgi:TolB-like protein/class 3 adenylate cyclase
MPETRKLAAILAADVAGYSKLAGVDEERTLARLRALRSDLFDPTIALHHGRVVKRTGDGILIEFRSVVDAVRCAIEVQNSMIERNAGLPPERRIELRVGIHLGDVVEESDGDLMGDGVNIAARLEGIAEPSGICLSEDAYRQVRDRLKEGFLDLGEKELKNIAWPVRAYAVKIGSAGLMPALEKTVPPRLSIVVLPFANIGGDPEQEYFVDGVTESLTTDLSRLPGAFVIARSTAFTYKGKAIDARQIGRDLGVRYVMEGSVQSGGNRIRVHAQLIDAETGAHVWAERFDKLRTDLFDMQDEITGRLARSLGIELVRLESWRAERKRPNNMDAIDLCLRGLAVRNQPFSLDRVREARSLFDAALRLDSQNVDALIGLSITHSSEVINLTSDKPAEQIRLADAAISKALAIAPGNAHAHYARARLLYASRATEQALRECELAISLDRNFAWAHAWAGFMKLLLGRAEETEAHVAEVMRLSPRDPRLGTWFTFSGISDLYLGRLDQAIDRLQKCVELSPKEMFVYLYLAAALALAGRANEAAEACATWRRSHPNFTLAKFRAETRGDNPIYLAQRERVYEGLRRAGMPEE